MSSVIVSAIPAFLHDPDIVQILHCVSEGARAAISLQRGLRSDGILGKVDQSPVTIADFAVQAIVADGLARLSHPLPLMAEESSALLERSENSALLQSVVQAVEQVCPDLDQQAVLRSIDLGSPLAWAAEAARPSRFFTLDPIDGTKGFIRGGQYVTALARIDSGEVDLAVLACPELVLSEGRLLARELEKTLRIDEVSNHKNNGTILISMKNCGVWARPLFDLESPWQRLNAKTDWVTEQAFAQAPLRLLTSFESSHTDPEALARFVQAFEEQPSGSKRHLEKRPLKKIPMDSQAKFALIASGDADVMLRFRDGVTEKIWDYAAGALMVTEAGGRVSDLDGRSLDFSCGTTLARNRGLIVTHPILYQHVIDALNQ